MTDTSTTSVGIPLSVVPVNPPDKSGRGFQIPVAGDGITIVNDSPLNINISTDENMQVNVFEIPAGTSLSFIGTVPYYVTSPSPTTILVLEGIQNYSGGIIGINTAYDILYTNTAFVIPNGGIGVNIVVTAQGTYYAIELLLAQSLPTGAAVQVSVSNEGTGQQVIVTQPLGGDDERFIVPISFSAGDTLAINVFTTAGFTTEAQVLAFRNTPVQFIANTPNTPLYDAPVGGKLIANQTVAGSSSVVALAAPPLGKCYRLHALTCLAPSIILTPSAGVIIGLCSGPTVFLGGQICMTALNFQNLGSSSIIAALTYDIINVPAMT
jgi:hypothetical protein